jgi:hypothetical protein
MVSDRPPKERSARGTLGNLESLGLPEIVQSLALARKTARLSVTTHGRWGHIWIENGLATHAQTHRLTGELAFYEMVGWKTGEFLLEPDIRTEKYSLDHDPMYLVMEGSRRLDELGNSEPVSKVVPTAIAALETIPLSAPRPDPSPVLCLPPARRTRPRATPAKRDRTLQQLAPPRDTRGRRRMWLLAGVIVPLLILGVWLPSRGLVAPRPPDPVVRAYHPIVPLGDLLADVEWAAYAEIDGSRAEASTVEDEPTPPPARRAAPAPRPAETEVVEAPAPPERSDIGALLVQYSEAVASTPPPPEVSFLRIVGKSSVTSGTLTVHVDGAEVYAKTLTAPSGKVKRMFGKGAEIFQTTIEIEPGQHEIMARIDLDGDAPDYGSSVAFEVDPGATRELRLVASRKSSRPLTLVVE